MNSPQHTRESVEALHAQNLEQEKLFQLIAALANCLDRDIVIETIQCILGIDPIEKYDCVFFDDIVVGFDEEGRVKSLYRVIDGTTIPAKVVIRSDSNGRINT